MIIEKLHIPSTPDQLSLVDEVAQKAAKQMGFNKEQSDDVSIAVTEIVNNAIMHGNLADPKKEVLITFRKLKNSLKIQIQDEGEGFKPDEVEDPTKEENIHKFKGRGIFIVKHLMDSVKFKHSREGMIISLEKRKH